MNIKKENLSADFQFAMSCEMIRGKGEDSVLSVRRQNLSMVAVFDGCGGLGAKQYESFGSHTGAYMASRAINAAALAWFEEICQDRSMLSAEEYRKKVEMAYALVDQYADKGGTAFKGSMRKPFPSTVAAAVTCFDEIMPETTFVWAGDSRGYFWDVDGLHQITVDDSKSEDAMENLHNDSPLTNVVAQSGSYVLHSHTIPVCRPTILFCATDGCFGYLQTPMDFEHLLLSTLCDSTSPRQWKENLTASLRELAGDDYTLAVLSVGFSGFDILKKVAMERKVRLEKEFLPSSDDASMEECVSLWNAYKGSYESMLANRT